MSRQSSWRAAHFPAAKSDFAALAAAKIDDEENGQGDLLFFCRETAGKFLRVCLRIFPTL